MLKRILNHRFLFFTIFILIAIMIFLTNFLPPSNLKDNLQLLVRDNSAAPVLKLDSELDLSSLSLSDNIDITTINPPGDEVISMYYTLPESGNDIITNELDTLVSSLYTLLSTANIPLNTSLTLSLLPNSSMTDTEYIEICQELNTILASNNLDKLSLILFPKEPKKFANITGSESFDKLGVTINTPVDFKSAQDLHDTFGDTKTLYIRDNILGHHIASDNTANLNQSFASLGSDINMLYYICAANLPKYTTIFSPYNTFDNTLSIVTENNAGFSAIYSRLLSEPWLTNEDVAISNTSPYRILNSYDKLEGDVELIVSPANTSLLSASNILYKINEVVPIIQTYKPYVLNFNTNDFPRGISRIKAVSQDSSNTIVQSIDVILGGGTTTSRPPRVENSYTNDVLSTATISETGYVPILMYHTISDTVLPENENSSVSTANFDAQMAALIENGYNPISFKQLHDYIEGKDVIPSKPVIITMDDGYLNNYTHAYPIYQKYNIQATLFVSPYYVKKENTNRHFGWDAAREMEASGLIDIQPHGYDHTPLPYLSIKDARYHVSIGLGLIEQNLGERDVKVVSYPQFRNTIFTKKALNELQINLQITNLIKPYQKDRTIEANNLKRINVPNTMSPKELISTLDSYQ